MPGRLFVCHLQARQKNNRAAGAKATPWREHVVSIKARRRDDPATPKLGQNRRGFLSYFALTSGKSGLDALIPT